MTKNENGWQQWGKHVLAELERVSQRVEDIDKRLNRIESKLEGVPVGSLEEFKKNTTSYIDAVSKKADRNMSIIIKILIGMVLVLAGQFVGLISLFLK